MFFIPKVPSAKAPEAPQLKAYCAALCYSLSTYSLTLCLTKRHRSFNDAVLMSFGSAKDFPKIL